MSEAKIGFELETIQVPLADLLPLRLIKEPSKIARYKAILVSLREVGLIEPLMVHAQKDAPGKYVVLDGNLRWCALKELGQAAADCILAKDDECFTYNARASRISPIQEHRMIVKAVNLGVSPDRIAAALNIPVRVVKAYQNLLNGINAEAADLLKDKHIAPGTLRLLRKVNDVRQLEIAELMVGAGNYTHSYAEALILGRPEDQLVKPTTTKQHKGISAETVARMEQEMVTLERDLKSIEAGYGENMLNLTLARAYVRKLLNNPAIARFMGAHYAEILAEFTALVATESL